MNKTTNILVSIASVTVIAILLLGIGYSVGHKDTSESVVYNDSDKNDVKLPGEKEARIVTVDTIQSKLEEMSELTTYCSEYDQVLGKDDLRAVLDDVNLFFTKKSITISAKGIVKVGYDVSDFRVEVDNNKIYITVPQEKLNDNYVIWDTVQCSEKNNIFNPIEFEQYQEIITEIEARGLEDAVNNGIYEKSDKQVKKLVKEFLSEFTDEYEIVYM